MKQWNITVDGVQYTVVFTHNSWSGRNKLTVNGEEVPLKKTPFQAFVGSDQPVNIGGSECRLVVIGSQADLAVNGTYIDSNKSYIPLKSMPWWTWIFVCACIAIPIISLGGALPVVIAILASIGCVRLSVSPTMKTAGKILSCLGITLAAWAVLIGISVLLYMI